jgi:hypothetical protein
MGTKISALPAATALTGSEVLAGVQSSGNVKVTANQMKAFALAGLATVASSGSGADLVAASVPLSRVATQAANTILGNNTGVSASPSALSGSQVTALLDTFSSGAKGLAPASGGGTSNFLRADGTWAPPALTGGVTSQTGTSYTTVLGDANSYIRFTNASPVTVTIPANAAVAYPVGTELTFEQAGAGALTIAGPGVTLNSRGSDLTAAGQFSVLMVKKTATDTWTVTGDL